MGSVNFREVRSLSLEDLIARWADCQPGSVADHAFNAEFAYRSHVAQLECTLAQTEATKAMIASVRWSKWMVVAVGVSAIITAVATLCTPLVSAYLLGG